MIDAGAAFFVVPSAKTTEPIDVNEAKFTLKMVKRESRGSSTV
jgi:hypothetical protein